MDNLDTTVCVVGFGNLGSAIASRLLAQGWNVSAYDRAPERSAKMSRCGVTQVELNAVADSKLIVFIVPDGDCIKWVLDNGVKQRISASHTLISHSTVLPDEAIAIEKVARPARFVDSPVSGGAERALVGELTLLVGGEYEPAVVERYLSTVGQKRVVMGKVGAASAVKLAHQLVLFSTLAGILEALRLTGHFGISDEKTLDALSAGLADSWVARNLNFFDQLSGEYEHTGVPRSNRPYYKDLVEFVEAGEMAGFDAPLARLLAQQLPQALEQHAQIAKFYGVV